MTEDHLPAEAIDALQALGRADIVIGIPAYQNARTIAGVVRAAAAGLAKYFNQYTSVIIVSDAGSIDGTREAVLGTQVEDARLLFLSHPLSAVHRLSVPYHGVPGKGSAFRRIFTFASKLGARACAVVNSDLLSVRPERIDLLLRPAPLFANYGICVEKNLQISFGKNFRANVAAFHDDAGIRTQRSLMFHHPFPDLGMHRDARGSLGHIALAYSRRDVFAVQQGPVSAEGGL